MKINEKIRMLREINNLTQEDMAGKLHMSTNGYANIERGDTRLTVEKLDKVAQAFDMDMVELIGMGEKSMVYLFSENNNGTQYGNYYQGAEVLAAENEKLQLIIDNQKDLLAQKDSEISTLKALVATLQNQPPNNLKKS